MKTPSVLKNIPAFGSAVGAFETMDYERAMRAIFRPQTVAVIGATETEGSVGRTISQNLMAGTFGGTVYPVHPTRSSVFGKSCFKDVASLPDGVELAVVVTPSATVPRVIADCAAKKIRAAIIISAGFKELGAKGAALERQIQEAASGRMLIVGPNCLGVMTPSLGYNATFASACALPGKVAFISQSGALCTAVLDWSFRERVGFSAFVSIGSMLDVAWGDLIDYLGKDPDTSSILIYMESVGDSRAFMSAAREVSLTKPVIVLKVGRTDSARQAAMSHTGSIAGSDDVLDAAFRRSGVLRVSEISELFYMAEILSKQPNPQGPRLAILTNAGGPGVLATDALIFNGGKLAELSTDTIAQLNRVLPEHWSHANPVDILGDAGPERYARAAAILSKDPNIDGLLTILTPQAMSSPTLTAQALVDSADMKNKPHIASWMGAGEVEKGRQILREAAIPEFPYPDAAAKLFNYMWQHTDNLKQLYQTPVSSGLDAAAGKKAGAVCAKIFESALLEKRSLLSEHESKRVLEAYGIPIVETRLAQSEAEAAKQAERLGYPVVVKLHSLTITHKSDVGGIRLDLRSAQAVRKAYVQIQAAVTAKKGKGHFLGVTVQRMIPPGGFELILGASPDVQFGPVILFGAGGVNVEIFKDVSLGLPPLNTTLARRLLERTRIASAFAGSRGRLPIDLDRLERVIVNFSQLVIAQRRIREIDINPLYASGGQIMALDARIVLYGPEVPDDRIIRPAIRPYPVQYSWRVKTKAGLTAFVRPIRAADEPLMVRFHRNLSEASVTNRFFTNLDLDQRIAHERLLRVCFNDYDRQIALVAEVGAGRGKAAGTEARKPKSAGSAGEIGAVARLNRVPHTDEAECTIVVADEYQRRGLGGELLERIVEVAQAEGMRVIYAQIQKTNAPMLHLFEKNGFTLVHENSEGHLKVKRCL